MTLQSSSSSSLRPYQQKLENARKRKEESEKQQPATGFRSVILRDETYIRYMHYGRPGNSFDEIAIRS
jgi:hypothetical protein